MLFEWSVLFTLSVGCLEVFSSQPNLVLTLRKIHESSDLEECLEFQLLVFQLVRSQFDEDDEAVGKSLQNSLWNRQPARGSTA